LFPAGRKPVIQEPQIVLLFLEEKANSAAIAAPDNDTAGRCGILFVNFIGHDIRS
jgi:hypothetical protein